ncbi:cytochrome P450 6B4-like [Pararge aegeria]|uniref:unspecific monooxygenase n=1 Tax=Pararge aegeria aegeria TaxID=348720 RepID=A0A8S4R117_9NEOP|nr:cytochrome P450 6B4-like [Pararge aegeria]CAH2229448.1 jg20841 [Pararge aegeria aegeria]
MAIYLVFSLFIGVLYFAYIFLFKNQDYWKNRNVPFVKPLPIFGNYKDYLLLKRHVTDVMHEMCQRFPNEPYVGSFYGTDPALIIKDPNLLKLVMSKDFYYFSGREASDHNAKEMLSKHLFFAHGDEWKVLRTNLTPLFSSAKLKNMFYLIKNSSDTLESLMADEVKKSSTIDTRFLLSRYTIDCITACAFGLNSDTMKEDVQNNPFKKVGEQIFDASNNQARKNICRAMWPGIFYALGFKLMHNDIGTFFNNLISGVFKNREGTKTSKNDFIDLILTWKRNNNISGDSMSNAYNGDKQTVSIDVDDSLLVAQCLLFFAAGFETTSSTMSFLLYELAKHKPVQEKVIGEVDDYFSKHKTIEYECINTMPYTEACVDEALRLYPLVGLLTREVMHEYTLPTGLRLKQGDRVHIPVHHIHHNPDHFPEPEVFRPERFFGEEKKNIKPFSYMPFGEGPRTCIGMRFAKMPIHAALLKIFKNYRVELGENMSHKITFNPNSVISQPIGGIHIKFIPRNS